MQPIINPTQHDAFLSLASGYQFNVGGAPDDRLTDFFTGFRGCVQSLSVFNDPVDESSTELSYGEKVNFAHSHSLGW